jgi:streptomycin 6-kinase
VAGALRVIAPALAGLPVTIPGPAGQDDPVFQMSSAAAAGPIPAWYPLVTTAALRERFGRLVRPEQQRAVERWCDWADEVLARPVRRVLVHGDLHGDNQVWSAGGTAGGPRLRERRPGRAGV